MQPPEPLRYTPTPAAQLRPLERRRVIRDSLDNGDWKTAARHLDHAHRTLEYRMVAGIRSHRDYHETLGISRSYDYFLRLTVTTGTIDLVSTFGAARRACYQRIPEAAHTDLSASPAATSAFPQPETI